MKESKHYLDLEKYYPVSDIADMFQVTGPGVRYWIKKGLATKKEKVIGIRPRATIRPIDVINFLGLDAEKFKQQ